MTLAIELEDPHFLSKQSILSDCVLVHVSDDAWLYIQENDMKP